MNDKSVLVIDTPQCCFECHYCHFYGKYGYRKCLLSKEFVDVQDDTIDILKERHKCCPLRPLPRKIDIKAQEDIDYQRFYENPDAKRLADEIVESQGTTRIGSTRDIYHAWNACLKEITGDCDEE